LSDDDLVRNIITHTESIKSLISCDGLVGGAVHLHCPCVVGAVDEVGNRLLADFSSTAEAHKVIGILSMKVSQATVLF